MNARHSDSRTQRRQRRSWKQVATAVAAAIPRDRLHPAVLDWAERERGSKAAWGVALSGGADSVALLLTLWAHWPGCRRRLRALHFDHQLRGAASRADAAFCRRLCAALGVRFVSGRWKRPASTRKPSEAEAREARLAFLAEHARVLWLGHHQDDVAETLLMRLARGSGAGGLSAPRPVQPMPGGRVHLRPLLTLRKADLVRALQAAGAPWCEDATNAAGDFFRNRIRREVLPAWIAAAQRDAIAGAARSRELLAEDDVALEAWVDQLAPVAKTGDLLLTRLREKPRAVLRRALHRWLLGAPVKVEISRQAFDGLLAAAASGRPTRQSLGATLFAVTRAGRVSFELGKRATKFQRRVN